MMLMDRPESDARRTHQKGSTHPNNHIFLRKHLHSSIVCYSDFPAGDRAFRASDREHNSVDITAAVSYRVNF